MEYFEDPEFHISNSLELLKNHEKVYLGGVNGFILQDHLMSIKHGLEFLTTFLKVSENEDLLCRIKYLVSNVKQKLCCLRYLDKDESLVMRTDHAYANLRKEMTNVVIKPGTNEFDVIFPEVFTWVLDLSGTSIFLCDKIKKLVTSDCKANKISPMIKELEGVRKMLTLLLEPFFIYAKYVDDDRLLTVKEQDIFSTIAAVIDRATCLVYLSFVGNMDDEMVLSLKEGLSDIIIEETQIMNMYLILDIHSNENLIAHLYMSLRLLDWNKRCYLGTERGAALEDHFVSIKQGLEFLEILLELSENRDLKRRIHLLVVIVKQKLFSLPQNVTVNLDAYGELREEMQHVVIKPGTEYYDAMFPEIFNRAKKISSIKDFLLEKVKKLVTSRCKAEQISPIMKELGELRKKIASLKPEFDYVAEVRYAMNKEEETIFAALTSFLDRATCLVYLCFVGKLNEDMLVSVRNKISLLIEETEIKGLSLGLGITWEDAIDRSLSLLKIQEQYHVGSTNEAILIDHIMSLEHGIEFLRWFPQIYFDRDFKRCIIQLAGNVKQKLERFTYEHGDGRRRLNMDVNGAYGDLREEMKNVIINPTTNTCDTLFPDCSPRFNDFLLEKIMTLVTSNCKAHQLAPVKKELQDLRNMLIYLKPLGLFVGRAPLTGDEDNISTTFLAIHHKATFLIYLCFVGKMDMEMVLLLKDNIETALKDTDVLEIYTIILSKDLFGSTYLEGELYLLENLILLLQSNVESLNDENTKLYEVLIDIHTFLHGLSRNVLLRKLHLLQTSCQAILGHSIPILYSCYLQHTEVDNSAQLNCILDLINHIKSESQVIKLCYLPRTDNLGFLDFFSGYLEGLMNDHEISMKEEIEALHFEIHSLLSLAKVTNQEELNETPWTEIINMAYQAEYTIGTYLVSSCRDLGLVSSLSKIIEQLKKMSADVQGLRCKSLPDQDVAVTSQPKVVSTTTQISDNDEVVGLQEDTRIVAEYILKGETKLDVISIVGMAGVGKTTLALTLYNTLSMADHFDILAWCTVSQSYRNKDVVLQILDQVNASDKFHRIISDDQELVDHFCRSLRKRKYLIVLDDLWDNTFWRYLKRYFPDDSNGSRILVTTRNKDVAHELESKMNSLHGLSEKKSWELFQKKMHGNERLSDDILKISKGIVEHCKGLPLSIIIIAGILSNMERTKEKWNQIEASVSSLVLSDPQGNCKAILELSYNHLPNHLKMCFLYMGLFPEDGEILVNHLIILWIAEGLVKDTKSNSAEEVAKKYMDDLIVKSLVIPTKERSRGGVKSFRLHDLLRDFCLDKAKEKHFFTLLDKRNNSRPLQDPRRLIINGPCISGINYSCHSIRSMICFDELEASEIEKGIGSCDMVLLEVLEVVGVWSVIFPNISSLIHLRYLALGFLNQKIYGLPSSISKLKNLQILILRCKYNVLIVVPDFIWDMVKLRRVHISPEASFQVDSKRLQNSSFLLENLISLSNARVSYGDSKLLNKLPGLQRVRCFFVDDLEHDDNVFVEELEGDDDLGQDADLEHNDDLKQDGDLESDDDSENNQSRMLSFNGHLTSLNVDNKTSPKQRFISTCQLPITLRKLTLSKFFFTSDDISKMGRALPHLEVFKLHSCYLPSGYNWLVGNEEFPELKVLKLRDLKISNWIASEYCFPKLEQLWVEHCNYLEEIPLDFGYLLNLRLLSVRECAPSVDDSAREIEKMQHEDQNTEMRVHIYPRKGNPDT